MGLDSMFQVSTLLTELSWQDYGSNEFLWDSEDLTEINKI